MDRRDRKQEYFNFLQSNIDNLHAERGLSQFDLPRRFVASSVYEFPIGEGKRFLGQGVLGKVIGGWTIGAILTFADGTPANVAQIGDTASLGTLGNQPDATGHLSNSVESLRPTVPEYRGD